MWDAIVENPSGSSAGCTIPTDPRSFPPTMGVRCTDPADKAGKVADMVTRCTRRAADAADATDAPAHRGAAPAHRGADHGPMPRAPCPGGPGR